jgi:hypothetical protein
MVWLSAICVAIAFSVIVAPSASAAGGCSGTRIYTFHMRAGTTTIAELRVFYNSSTGRNCAMTVHVGPTVGKKMPTQVALDSCLETQPDSVCTPTESAWDDGEYSYYAGPVSVYGRGHCIDVAGSIYYKYQWYVAYSTPHASFCD